MDGKLPLICLSASGGGHVRQLLDLQPFWSVYPRFFVTEDTVLGRSFDPREQVEFVPHFALGQARMGKALMMLVCAARSFWQSGRIILGRRPDVVITTGAGSQLFLLLWARLIGARVVLVDSFARFQAPSKFARLAGRLAHVRITQSAESARRWRGAIPFDPLRTVDAPCPPKEPLVFATVGAILPLDRLSQLVAAAKKSGLITQRVILQTGRDAAPVEPVEGLEIVEELPFAELRHILERAELVICHGGSGSLITALSNHCKVIAMPRRVDCGDSYDDHQLEITEAFRKRGLIEVAEDEASLAAALAALAERPPVAIRMDHTRLAAFLNARVAEFFPKHSRVKIGPVGENPS